MSLEVSSSEDGWLHHKRLGGGWNINRFQRCSKHFVRLGFFRKVSKMNTVPELLKVKEKYLNMTQENRRKTYGKDVLILSSVATWNAYYKNDTARLQELDKDFYINKFSIKKEASNPQVNDKVSIWKGDITKLEVDAVVTAANNGLLGGLGVDGAIHKAAGKHLLEECQILQGCETGEAKITGGYELPAKYVIHTVGPREERADLLSSCYEKSMKILLDNNLRSIAFPCISTGVYGYPQDSAANVAIKTMRAILENNHSSVDRVIFCLFSNEDVKIYETMMQLYFPVS